MGKLTIFIAIILSFLVMCEFTSCVHDPTPALPAITFNGLNTFGCVLNGEIWIPAGRPNVPPVTADATESDFYIIWGARSTNDGFTFFLKTPILINHAYDLLDTAQVKVTYGFTTGTGNGQAYCGFEAYQITSGSLTISRWDSQKSVLAGIFNFKAYNSSCLVDTLKVAQGRFDIGYITF